MTLLLGTVVKIYASGAYVDFGFSVPGLLPQRLIHWPVHPGDELHELTIAKIDEDNLRVVLGVDNTDVARID